MNHSANVAGVVKQFGLLALLGGAVVLLAGPIIGVLSVALSLGAVVFVFAAIGFVAWTLFQATVHGPQAAVDRLKNVQAQGQAFINQHGGNMRSVFTWPFYVVRGLIGGLALLVAVLFKSAWTSFWFVTEVAIVAVTGVVVGGVVGWAMANPSDGEAATISYAAVGGALAAVVGVVLTLRERASAGRVAVLPRYRFDSTVVPQ